MSVEGRGWVTRVGIDLVNWQQEEPADFDGRRQLSMGGTSRMSREAQVRICERPGAKFPGPTRRQCSPSKNQPPEPVGRPSSPVPRSGLPTSAACRYRGRRSRCPGETPAPAVQHVGAHLQRPRRFAHRYPLFQPPPFWFGPTAMWSGWKT